MMNKFTLEAEATSSKTYIKPTRETNSCGFHYGL